MEKAKIVSVDALRGYNPHPKQVEFHEDSARFRAFVGGIGSGKTEAGVGESVKQALLQAGSRGAVVAPTYPMLKDVILPVFRERLSPTLIDGGWSKGFNASDLRLRLVTGSEILFRSADKPDRLRGLNLAWFWIDEAALCHQLTWKILIGRLRQQGFIHRGWITTTPKGRNWVYRVFVEEATPNHSLIRATSHDNPYLTPEFLSDLERSYDDKFYRQEVLAEFVEFDGLVYAEFSREFHTAVKGPDRYRRVVIGVDYGYTNPSAVLVVAVDEYERVWVIDEWYKRHRTQPEVADIVSEMVALYGADAVFVDPSAASLVAEIRQRRIAAKSANNDVLAGISKIRALLQKRPEGWVGLKVLRKCPYTISEFESYELEHSADGFKDKPKKINDHAMDALRYAVMGLFEKPRVPLRYDGEVDPLKDDFSGGIW